jgi:tetratricopeptide (TPR) repeat protein
MAKLTRCPAGHVYDRDAHEDCPECARLGVKHEPPPAEPSPSEAAATDTEKLDGGLSGIPKSWLAVGGGAAALLLAAFLFLGGGGSKITDPKDAKADADFSACTGDKTDASACERAVASGKYAGPALGALYRSRGYSRHHADKPDLDGAIADYSKAVELEKGTFAPLSLRGDAYLDAGKNDLAIADFDAAIAIDPLWHFFEDRGTGHLRKGELDRALADYDEAIKRAPEAYHPYWNRGDLWRKKGDNAKAAEDYRKALSLKPGDANRKKIEANLAKVTADLPAAKSPQEKAPDAAPAAAGKLLPSAQAILADPDFKACKAMSQTQVADCDRAIASGKFEGSGLAVLYNNRGQAHSFANADDAALADFSKAVEINPQATPAYSNRGAVYYMKKDYDRALADLDKAISLDQSQFLTFNQRGLVHWSKGNVDAAVADFKKALSLNPPDKFKVRIEESLKQIEGGAKFPPDEKKQGALEPNVVKPPEGPLKSVDEAMKDADYANCIDVENIGGEGCDSVIATGKFGGSALAQLYVARGVARDLVAKGADARQDYSSAIALDPGYSYAYYMRAASFNADKEYDKALADLSKALELGNKNAHFLLGNVLCSKQDYERGIAELTEALKIKPNNRSAYSDRAGCYAKKGEKTLAAADYKAALALNPDAKTKAKLEKALQELGPVDQSAAPSNDKNSAPPGPRDGASGKDASINPVSPLPPGQGVPAPVTTLLPGVYRLTGSNPNGEKYYGQVRLTKDGSGIRATIWNGDHLIKGKGTFSNGVLSVKYNSGVNVTYSLKGDGTFDGRWWRGTGTERLEPVSLPPDAPLQIAEGDYRIDTKQSDGKLVGGTAKITKSGRGYHIVWAYSDGDRMEGSGTVADNILVLDGGGNPGWEKSAAVIYGLQTDGSLHGLFASGFGEERLIPAGSAAADPGKQIPDYRTMKAQ